MSVFDSRDGGYKKPSINIAEIFLLSDTIKSCSDLRALSQLYNQKGNYNNPQISLDFGISFFQKGDKASAKKALIKGASFGLGNQCVYYDSTSIDAIGHCYMLLLTQYPLIYPTDPNHSVIRATILSYIYLSRCIELAKMKAYDSYRTRALLIKDHERFQQVWQSILMNSMGRGIILEPFMISDFYFASQITGSPHQDLLQTARKIHQRLDDTTIGGKDADEYSLSELAEVGEKRHLILFKTLEEKYFNGKFNLTLSELLEINGKV